MLLFILLFHLKVNGKLSRHRCGGCIDNRLEMDKMFELMNIWNVGLWRSWSANWMTKETRRWHCPYWKAIIKAAWICFHRRIRNLRIRFRRQVGTIRWLVVNGILGIRLVRLDWVHPNSRHRPPQCSASAAAIAWLHRPIPLPIHKILGEIIRWDYKCSSFQHSIDYTNHQILNPIFYQ